MHAMQYYILLAFPRVMYCFEFFRLEHQSGWWISLLLLQLVQLVNFLWLRWKNFTPFSCPTCNLMRSWVKKQNPWSLESAPFHKLFHDKIQNVVIWFINYVSLETHISIPYPGYGIYLCNSARVSESELTKGYELIFQGFHFFRFSILLKRAE